MSAPTVRVVPQNLEAEQSVLGAVLLSDTALAVVAEELIAPEDFYVDAHEEIFRAMVALRAGDKPIDALTLAEYLRSAGRLEAAGGQANVDLLAGAVPVVGNVRQYAAIVRRCALERRRQALAWRIAENPGDARLIEKLHALGDEERPVRQPKLRVLDIERMLTTEPEPVQWIAEPLLARGHVTMKSGREGQGKSMFALALASAIAYGASVAGITCQSGRVMVIDAENGERETHRRLRGLGFPPGSLVYVEAEGFSLARDLHLVEDLLAEHVPDLVIFDSFRSLAPGVDENDSGECEAALGPLRNLSRRHDCAVLILHHAGKNGDSYRGSSGIGAAVELGFTLARHEDDPDARTRRRLSCWKCRIAPEPPARWLTLEADEGRVLVGEADPFTGDGPGRTQQQRLADAFAEVAADRGDLAWGELCSAAGADPESGTAKRARELAIERGTLCKAAHGTYGPTDRPTGQPGRTDEQAAADSDVHPTVRPPTPLGAMDGRTVEAPTPNGGNGHGNGWANGDELVERLLEEFDGSEEPSG